MHFAVIALALLVAACAGPSSEPTSTAPPRADRKAPRFKPSALRQPAVFVRVEVAASQMNPRQVSSLPAEYEGALLEGLNARAVPARDVRLVAPRERLVPADALARAREVGADHVLVVDARLHQTETAFCRDARPFRAMTAVWSQKLQVLRASDGVMTFETKKPIDVAAVEPDCDAPRDSKRRSPAEHLSAAVDTLLKRLLGS